MRIDFEVDIDYDDKQMYVEGQCTWQCVSNAFTYDYGSLSNQVHDPGDSCELESFEIHKVVDENNTVVDLDEEIRDIVKEAIEAKEDEEDYFSDKMKELAAEAAVEAKLENMERAEYDN